MQTLLRLYAYFYYKLFKFWEVASIPKFLSDWKASLTLDVLEIMIALSGICYYTIISKKWIDFGDNKILVFVYIVLIAVPNHFFFNYNNRWKSFESEFDKWSKEKNAKGTIVVICIVVVVVLNLILSFYLLGKNRHRIL